MKDEMDRKQSSRRGFLIAAGGAGCVAALWSFNRPVFAFVPAGAANAPVPVPARALIVEFSTSGKVTGKAVMPRLVKTEDEWKKQLSPIAYQVTRQAGTERPYTGKDWDVHDAGVFRCACCNIALFSSETKFDSGTGWPSFWQPIAKENVTETHDSSLGYERTAVSCTHCDAHLGHVFDDGPRPTGLRYCMNAAAMSFVKRAA